MWRKSFQRSVFLSLILILLILWFLWTSCSYKSKILVLTLFTVDLWVFFFKFPYLSPALYSSSALDEIWKGLFRNKPISYKKRVINSSVNENYFSSKNIRILPLSRSRLKYLARGKHYDLYKIDRRRHHYRN